MSQSDRQADTIAVIALSLPEQPVTRDILMAMTRCYRAGWQAALDQSAADLKRALVDIAQRNQAGA